MTVLFGGGEMSAFTPSDSTVIESTAGGFYDSNFARCAIYCNDGTAYAEGAPSASATDIWLHFDILNEGTSSGTAATRISWYDSSGNERVRVTYVGSSTTLAVTYWNGTTFATAGSAVVNMSNTRHTVDLNVVCNSASGSITLYIAGTERISSGTIDTSNITNLKNFRLKGATISSLPTYAYYSQVIVADEPTIGWRLVTRHASGAGATTDWTGDYTSIDETVYADADFILSSVADQVELFTNTGPGLTGYTPRAVVVSSRSRRGASGPQNMRHALRVAGTTYFSGSDIALGVAYAPKQTIWETDPATTSDWLASAIGSIQFGVKSIT